MPHIMSVPEKQNFFSLLPEEMDRALAQWGWARYRGQQIRQRIYHQLDANPGTISNLSKTDRKTLDERFDFALPEVAVRQQSDDGTWKILAKFEPDAMAEAVVIPDANRRTACISSQIGCPVGCKFCASG